MHVLSGVEDISNERIVAVNKDNKINPYVCPQNRERLLLLIYHTINI